jgi:hypothetical protein
LIGVGGDDGTVAVVVDVGEEVVQNGVHFDRSERGGIAALFRDAVASTEVIARTALQNACTMQTRCAFHALVAGAIIAATATVFDVTVSPYAAIINAGRRAT